MTGSKGAEKAGKAIIDDIVKKVSSGEIPLNKVDEYVDPQGAAEARRLALERILGVEIHHAKSPFMDYSAIFGKNAENVFGSVSIPMGAAGPLEVNGKHAKGKFYVPMATTEGALIASVNRGAKAVTSSGGATARVIGNMMTRGPVFRLESVSDVEDFLVWIEKNKEEIMRIAGGTTNHGTPKGIMPFVLGNNVWLRFGYDTGDAMGMNMVTIATETACRYIEEKFGRARLIAVSGNLCSDKKESFVNSLLGRGKTVIAEALISGNVLSEIFHGANAVEINDLNLRKNWLGSARAGSSKYNAHFANSIAAMFIATGQDPAQVVESSSGYTWTEVRGNSLYISVTLTSLEVGTIGGGTGLPVQREALSMLGAYGSGEPKGSNSLKLSEIMAAAVLSGELNLLAALSNRELGKAHKRLGRNARA